MVQYGNCLGVRFGYDTQKMIGGVEQLRWQCYCHNQQNPYPHPDSLVLAGEVKEKSMLSLVLRERNELREDRAYD